ncbi:MAG: cytochrome c [Bacteroidota bacterium]
MRILMFGLVFYLGWLICFKVFPSKIGFETEVYTRIDGGGVPTATPASAMINKKTVGGKLFMENCARCHSPRLGQNSTGPSLLNVLQRVDREKLIPWIKNAPSVLEEGDKYFQKLWRQYNKAMMDPMPHLTDEDVNAIIDEISLYSGT